MLLRTGDPVQRTTVHRGGREARERAVDRGRRETGEPAVDRRRRPVQQSQSIVGDARPVLGTLTPPAAAPRPSAGGNRGSAATRTVVSGTWRVTRPRNDPAAAVSSWAGIGLGRRAAPLIQAGSAAGGYFGPYLWWRVVPQRPNEQRISLDTAPGDTVYVRIQLLRGRAAVTIRDENTGAGGTYVLRYSGLDG